MTRTSTASLTASGVRRDRLKVVTSLKLPLLRPTTTPMLIVAELLILIIAPHFGDPVARASLRPATWDPAGARLLPTENGSLQMPAERENAAADRQDMVINAALELAAERGWDQVRFHLLAERTGVPMPEIGAEFRDVDAIANVWFARARFHLLGLPETALADLSPDARIATACERWLDFLAPHRAVAAEILRGKLWPAHAHHWVPLVFNLSRLVHDLLDTARVPGEGTLRVVQEVGLTLMFLATLRDWVRDRSEAQAWTKRRLRHRLARAGRAAACLVCSRRIGSPQRPAR